MQILLYAVFVLSGAAGLIYESIWSRYLGLFVGHSAYAQIIVLTIFLGGMSFGAWAVSRWSDRLKEPLVTYAFLELAIGAIGWVFHDIYRWATAASYDAIFPHLAGSPVLLTVVKWAIASALILPQSILLGTTFPLMSAGVLRLVRREPGRVLSLLYFANSLGAALGVLVAGFYLLRASGLEGTLVAAAVLNGIVFLVTLSAVRIGPMITWRPARSTDAVVAPAPAPALIAPPMPLGPDALWRLLLLVAFGTAVASFAYEISWIRMLSQVLGSATHSFELMLSAFILGLALGALWVRRRADQFADPLRALGIVQWMMGFAAMATIPLYLWSFKLTAVLIRALAFTEGGYAIFGLARYAFCLVVMLPATFCAGMTLPVITKLLLETGRGERAVGSVYAVNTFGSIVGVILAGLVLLPLMGVKLVLIEGAVLDMALGVLLLRITAGTSVRRQRFAFIAAGGVLIVTLATIAFNSFDTNILSSGVFRYGNLPEPGSRIMLYYQDGRTASVSVGRSTRGSSIFIATNGKPDASLDTTWFLHDPKKPLRYLGGDMATQVLLPLITLAFSPNAENAAVIGQGSGMTSHLLLGSPSIKRLTTIEIEPAMIAGSRFFSPSNHRVFDDPRSHFAIDDAKSFFAASDRTFDVIVSEPSNPWVSGVSGLFTLEFYSRVKRYLSPNGVFGQWLHLYEIDDGLVLSVLSALHQNFASYQIYMTSSADILIVASNRSTLPAPDWSVFDSPMTTEDLRSAVRFTPRALDAARLGGRADFAPVLDQYASPNSDFVPVLDLGAERARFMHANSDGMIGLNGARFDLLSALSGQRVPFDTAILVAVPSIPRMRALALGAVLRRRRETGIADSVSGIETRAALQRRSDLDNAMASGRPPADWRLWTTAAVAAERDLHGGTAGVVDDDFYRSLFSYLSAQRAPTGARQSIAFLHALAGYDFPAASALADSLLPDAAAGASWYAVDDLREGGTVAKLRTGDVDGAYAYWVELGKHSIRPPNHLRTLILGAYVVQAHSEKHSPPVVPTRSR